MVGVMVAGSNEGFSSGSFQHGNKRSKHSSGQNYFYRTPKIADFYEKRKIRSNLDNL